ncbi:MAG: hypothetical protein IJN97_07335, partial [Oscillospiraceae bacterium]|nr:hypothetical protein [Oscillospiraceae bacterium]
FSKKKKLTDRAFKLRIAMLMTSMLACAAVMASSAFALFEHNINSETKLTAATFALATAQQGRSVTGNVHWNVTGDDDKHLSITGPKGVIGYCKIAITNPQEVTTLYYTPAFSGNYTTTITVPAEWRVAVVDATWGYPSVEPELIIGGALTISEPEQQTEQSEEKLTLTSPAPPVSDNTSETTEKTPEQADTTVNEKTETETTAKAENSETTVTPSVSEEKASAEVSNSTVTEAPVTSTPPSDSTSGEGSSGSFASSSSTGSSSDSSGVSSPDTSASSAGGDSGASSGSSVSSGGSDSGSSSGASEPSGGSPPSSSDGGGE